MGNRDIHADALAASAAAEVCVVLAVFLDYPSAPVRVHSGVGTLTIDGFDFYGVGDYGGVETIEEPGQVQAAKLGLTLSGIPTDMISHAFENAVGEAAKLWAVFLDLTDPLSIEGEAVLLFQGLIDNATIKLGDTASVLVTLENPVADWERPRLHHYNDVDQKQRYPDDRGLEYVDDVVTEQVEWGPVPDTRTRRGR